MKYSFAAATLLALAAAQPHGHHAHAHKRDVVVMETDYVTATAAPVYVYVDQNGNSISGPDAAEETPAPAAAPVVQGAASAAVSAAAVATPAPAVAPSVAPAVAPAASAAVKAPAPVAPAPKVSVAAAAPAPLVSAAAAPAPLVSAAAAISAVASPATSVASSGSAHGSGSGSAATGLGITYSPYNSDGSCKTSSEVSADLDMLTAYKAIRIYNTDCDQINTVGTAAAKHGMSLFAGIFDITDVQNDIQTLISGFKSNWAGVATISIGNELVNSKKASVAQVVAAINIARPILRAAGFKGDVVTVDTNNVVLNLDGQHPDGIQLCKASDHCAFNAHPFFAPVAADQAGSWARGQVDQAAQMLGDSSKKVVIAECGFPSQGEANGPAVPSMANQQTAVEKIKGEFTENMFLFTAFNDLWKPLGAFNSEKYWGVYGTSNQ